ncbi:hypothetical protein [Maricaulis sp.]|uniref:hypothetical protein n=1 Tax=Maricaulis sp. TaxID=1486257 RepID=UPI002B26D422|nr:hypothetical protein [Maricaulis sp.]
MTLSASLHDLVRTIDEVQTWAFDQIRQPLPSSITRLGSRAVARLAQLNESGLITTLGVLERSWFGAERVAPDQSRAGELPLRLALPDSAVFRRQVDINPAIASRGRTAIRARLARSCPLPDSEAVLVWSHAGGAAADQARMTMWVAHKDRVEHASRRASNEATDWEVVTKEALTGERSPALAVAPRPSRFGLSGSTPVPGLLVLATICAVLMAADFRQTRALNDVTASRTALLDRADHLRDLAGIRSDVDAIVDIENEYPRPGSVARLLQELAISTNQQLEISRIELIDPTTLRVSVSDPANPEIDINLPDQDTPNGP